MTDLARTPLFDLHEELGARIVPFAGYALPVQYPAGVMKEHLHTRAQAGLFDVSHMGQIHITPKSGDIVDAALALESLMPVDVAGLKVSRQRYGLFTSETGGILDDLMFANMGDRFFLVVNGACKTDDIAHLRAHLSDTCKVEVLGDRALVALQGPEAHSVLARRVPGVADMKFMDVAQVRIDGADCVVSRSGYTGEDGFEISIPAEQATAIVRGLLSDPAVAPVGLGARDSLRLEAGLCLYGHDIDATTSPVEAGLSWAIQKSRRQNGARAGGFPGAARILGELETGPARRRVGLLPSGRAPMREGVEIFTAADPESPVGRITSGAFGPSVNGPVAMGYVPAELATVGTVLMGALRGKMLEMTVSELPFVTTRYKR